MHRLLVFLCIGLFTHSSIAFALPKQATPSLDEKIGQMILVGFRGTHVKPSSAIVQQIRHHHIGGVVLYNLDQTNNGATKNVESPAQLSKLCKDLRTYTEQNGETPLLIAIDQEGGTASHLPVEKGFPALPSAEELGQKDSLKATRHAAKKLIGTLQNANINVAFVPVLDLRLNPDNPIIAVRKRSFGADPLLVSKHAKIFSKELSKAHIACSMKHFPGHGSSAGDSHLGFVDISDTWQESELEPYRQLIADAPCPMVMMAHVYQKKLDPEFPASLSESIIHDLLREKLHFKGVVVADDLQMRAITQQFGFEEAITRAVNAGNDVLIFSNNISSYDDALAAKVHSTLKKLVKSGAISRARIDEAYGRIMEMKGKL